MKTFGMPSLIFFLLIAIGFATYQFNKKQEELTNQITILQEETSELTNEKGEIQKKYDEFTEEQMACREFHNYCDMLVQDRSTFLGQYRKTGSLNVSTYVLRTSPNWVIAATVQRDYSMFLLNQADQSYSMNILRPGPQIEDVITKECVFPNGSEEPDLQKLGEYLTSRGTISMPFGKVKLGWTPDQSLQDKENKIYFCEETEEGSSVWKNETGIGIIALNIPYTFEEKQIMSALSLLKNVKLTQVIEDHSSKIYNAQH